MVDDLGWRSWYHAALKKSRTNLVRLSGATLTTLFTLGAVSCAVPPMHAEAPRENVEYPEYKGQPVYLGVSGELGPSEAQAAVRRAVGDADMEEATRFLTDEYRVTGRPVYTGNRITLLVDGPSTYAAMLEAIRSAIHHIHMESYVFADDSIGEKFASALVEASKRGVIVRLIYDGFGSLSTDEDFFKDLEDKGIEVREFHPPEPTESIKVWKINNRNHRKLLIVDGRTVFVGGINITSVYGVSSRSKPGPKLGLDRGWRDTHVKIDGPVAASYEEMFFGNWNRLGDEIFLDEEYDAEIPSQGNALVRAVCSKGGNDAYEIYQVYRAAILNARRTLYITHAYFSPDAQILNDLQDAARRGVDVRIVVPGFSDSWSVYHASRANFDDLLSAGVRIYERKDALVHSKTAVADGVWATVGSSNFDPRSFIHNDELNATIVDADFAKAMEELFYSDIEQAHEITLEAWRDRPLSDRIKEFASKQFNYWL